MLFYNQNKEFSDKNVAGTFSENIIENKTSYSGIQ
jgi:hypothetical protein